jgi:hypothetical protein
MSHTAEHEALHEAALRAPVRRSSQVLFGCVGGIGLADDSSIGHCLAERHPPDATSSEPNDADSPTSMPNRCERNMTRGTSKF